MTAEDCLKQGDIKGALKLLQEQIKKKPDNAELRVFLFQLLSVMGQWDRALTQLDVVADLDDGTLAMVSMYRQVIACERIREQVFSGKKEPIIFGKPNEWVALLIQALKLTAQGENTKSQQLRIRAFDAAEITSGLINEQAFEWLISKRLDDGAWPVGIASGNYGGIAGYRRLAHSRWGCRSNTTAVLTCLAYHPKRRISEEAKRALDLILGTDMKLRSNLGFLIARLIGLEKSIGRITFMAKFDIAHILNLCWRVEASVKDSRIAEFVEFIKSEQGPYGLWEYINHPQATRWLTFDLLRSLSKLETQEDWISLEPLTPFRSYPKKIKRF